MALRLQIISDQSRLLGEHATVVFGPRGGRIGRAPDNDWVLPDPNRFLSAHHATIHPADDRFEVEDTSKNGVYANGEDRPIGRDLRRTLADGDVLRLGDYRIRVHIDPIPVVGGLSDALVAVDHVEPVRRDLARQRPSAAEPGGSIEGSPAAMAAATAAAARNAEADAVALQAFCRGAGIDAGSLPRGADNRALVLAGQLVREALLGLQELLRARRDFHRQIHTTPAPAAGEGPPPDSASCGEYLLTLLNGHLEGDFDAIKALRGHYGGLRRHDVVLAPALVSAMGAFLRNFSPEILEGRSRGRGGPELAWPLYVELFRSVTTSARGDLPPLYVEALMQAYDKALKDRDGQR
ncbi:MAG: hypothetical protein RLZZ200_3131 [Pseudomonadota bacterium]|jgi:type VI secretion system protein